MSTNYQITQPILVPPIYAEVECFTPMFYPLKSSWSDVVSMAQLSYTTSLPWSILDARDIIFLGWQLYWSSKLSLFLFIFDITFNIGHFHFCIFNFEFGYSLSSTRSSNGIGHFTMLAVDNCSSNNIFLNVVGFCYMNDFEEFYTKIIRPGRWWVYGVFIHIWRAQTQRQMKIWKGHGRKRNG